MLHIFIETVVISLIFTRILIPILEKLKAGQNIRQEGPESHLSKSGTPSMGGIAIILAIFVSSIIANIIFSSQITAILIAFLGYGMIGFIDDYTKVVKKRNLGLTAKQKLLMQILISFIFVIYHFKFSEHGKEVYIPLYDSFINIGIWYVIVLIFILVAMVNSVNLTDGLDGLATSTTLVIIAYLAYYANTIKNNDILILSIIICGALLGFLFWNKNPAKIFMGDTGSLSLGGIVGMIAISLKVELILPILCFVFMIETISVMIQVYYFKKTGKRVFKMAPIHHHFELSGMNENKVVSIFVAITAISVIATHIILK